MISSRSKPTRKACLRPRTGFWPAVLFPPRNPTNWAQRVEQNRSREERRTLRLQATTPEQVCFVGAGQIGELKTTPLTQGKKTGKSWALITSAEPPRWQAKDRLQGRRDDWGIEGKLHQRLDATLDEDRSRVRTPRGLTVLGMFRRLGVSFACAWLTPQRRKQKQSAWDFLDHLNAENARRAFSLVTSACPKAWRGG